MKDFFKYTLATITGIILASIIFFIILIAALSAIVASGDKPVTVSENSVLVLNAGIMIPDRGTENPLAGLDFTDMSFNPTPGLNEILRNIRKASADSKIKGILIENGLIPSGWATTGEIREALLEFRDSGKFVISYTDYLLTQQCYYLSTAADKIYVNPDAMVEFKGLSSEVIFFKNALEKLGIEVQVTRHGKFKGAVEPFILDKLSEENKEQIKDYTGSIWKHVIETISEARGIPVEKLSTLADNLAGNIAASAWDNNLVDGLLFRDQMIDTLKTLAGVEKDKDLKLVSMTKYGKVHDPATVFSTKNRISVIYAEGNIVMDKGNETNIGGRHYAEVIRKERLDTAVKAIVLRVNSPGGNAIASDEIWREITLAKKTKPVVISMGNYAASGGYYISCPATKIYASPVTISGSIGVFGLLPNAGKLMEKKLGLNTETVNTNMNSDFPSVFRPMNTYEKEVMQLSIEKIYSEFVDKVASGREMTYTEVDNIGQGRVWSGSGAMKIGLVDEIGGLKDAIKGAAELASIDKYKVKELPELEDPYTRLLTQLSGDVRMSILKKELGEAMVYYKRLIELKELSGIQARLPYFIDIR
ncbi:MAG: signal peptide peptidase SppA [Bacteroidetes bacterium]|nr:signal peptide peptidase SppA [Bacteroidota bacterium]